jgi:acetyl esterase
MALDAHIQRLVDRVAALGDIDFTTVTPDDFRRRLVEVLGLAGGHPAPSALDSIEDRTIPGPGGALALRLYRPLIGANGAGAGAPRVARDASALAAVVYCHGGGWVMGDIGGHDGECRPLCQSTGAVVVSVDYRLAPHHPFPAALDDCTAAVEWVTGHADALGIDATRICIAGDSAGANLAAAVPLRLRDTGAAPTLCGQVLVGPPLDLTCTMPSITAKGRGYLLDADAVRWMCAQYLGGHAPNDPYASPLHAAGLSGLPPAVVATAEFDPLRDEALAYAERLAGDGVPVTVLDFPGLVHGFLGLRGLSPAAAAAGARVWGAARALLGGA